MALMIYHIILLQKQYRRRTYVLLRICYIFQQVFHPLFSFWRKRRYSSGQLARLALSPDEGGKVKDVLTVGAAFYDCVPDFLPLSRYEGSRMTGSSHLLPANGHCPCISCSLEREKCQCLPTTITRLIIVLCLFRLQFWEECSPKKNTPSLRRNSWPGDSR